MAITLAQLDTELLGMLNLESNESVFGQALREQTLNSIQKEIFAEDFPFPFARKKFFFSTAVKTTLQTALTTSSITVEIGNATGWATSGSAIIGGDVFAYTGLSGTTLTGVTGINQSHKVGLDVTQLYALPTDFNNDDVLEVDSIPFTFVDSLETVGDQPSSSIINHLNHTQNHNMHSLNPVNRWSIVHDNNGNEFIVINNLSTSVNAILHYNKIPPTMTSSQDASIPDSWALEVIAPLAAGRLLVLRGDDEDNLGSRIELVGKRQKLKMKKSFSQRGGGYQKRFGLANNYKTRTA